MFIEVSSESSQFSRRINFKHVKLSAAVTETIMIVYLTKIQFWGICSVWLIQHNEKLQVHISIKEA